jgi:hypothetical protein
MAYTVDDLMREGGLVTEDERIDVLLPVGSHVLELVVEDSAGLRSAPAIVTITVESEPTPGPGPVTEPGPTVGFMFPFAGIPGDSMLAVVFGLHLLEAPSVEHLLEATRVDVDFPIRAGITAEALVGAAGEFEPSEGVGESLLGSGTRSPIGGAGGTFPGGLAAKTLNYLPVRLSISDRTAVGEYPFTVTTRNGTDESARPFTVAAEVAAIKAALEMIPEIGTVTAKNLKENGIQDVFGFLATELRALAAILGEEKARRTKAAAANLLLNMAVSSSRFP